MNFEIAMRRCIELARQAAVNGGYPLGSVIVLEDEIIAEAADTLIHGNDPTAHPEICAIRSAAAQLKSRYLPGAFLISTLEPCPMCASAAIWAKMKGIVFGTTQQTAKAFGQKLGDPLFTFRQIDLSCQSVIAKGEPKLELYGGVLEPECDALLDLAKAKVNA